MHVALHLHLGQIAPVKKIGRLKLNTLTAQGKGYLIPFPFLEIDATKQIHGPVIKFIELQGPLQFDHCLAIIADTVEALPR